jgi:hypothetical protein
MRLLEPCASRKEYGEKLWAEAEKLCVSGRALHQYRQAWQERELVVHDLYRTVDDSIGQRPGDHGDDKENWVC